MKQIKVKFVDFWPTFNPDDNVFVSALSKHLDVKVLEHNSAERPDILFYTLLGIDHYRYHDCIKVYYTGENDVPDFNECDYALSFHNIDFNGRHMRYPLYMTYEIDEALTPPALTDAQALNRGFCTLLMRNADKCDPMRLKIIDAVNRYKPLAFGGPYRNNIGGAVPQDEKISFTAGYKFNLALENTSIPGYITEKIVEPFAAPTVPIYWGAPDIARDFNPEAYINVSDYDSIDSFIADLQAIDNDPARYLAMLRAPRLKAGRRIEFDEMLSEFLCGIALHGHICRPFNAMGELIYRRNRIQQTVLHSPRLLSLLARLRLLPTP